MIGLPQMAEEARLRAMLLRCMQRQRETTRFGRARAIPAHLSMVIGESPQGKEGQRTGKRGRSVGGLWGVKRETTKEDAQEPVAWDDYPVKPNEHRVGTDAVTQYKRAECRADQPDRVNVLNEGTEWYEFPEARHDPQTVDRPSTIS